MVYADTSRMAWHSIQHHLTNQEFELLKIIRTSGMRGMAAFEVEEHIDWKVNVVTARMRGLKQKKAVISTGKTRTTPSGRQAEVFRATVQR